MLMPQKKMKKMTEVNLNVDEKVITDVQAVLDKAQDIKQRFADSLAKAEEDESALQEEIESLQHEEQEIYSLYVMDEVDLTAYNDAKKATAEKRNLLSAIQGKIASIDTVQQQELKKLYNDAKSIINAFTKAQIKVDDEVKMQLLEAKY